MTAWRLGDGTASPPPIRIDGRRYLSKLVRMWRSGARDAVEADLATLADMLAWRLTLDAVRYIRRFERDHTARPSHYGLKERAVVVHAIIAFGHLAAARAFLAAIEGQQHPSAGLAELATLLAHAPDRPAAFDADFIDDPAADIQVVRRAGASTVLFVFTGGAMRFNGPLTIVDRWFRRLEATIVYLRDFDGMFYLGGIRSLGDGYGAAVRGLRGIAASLGATRIACIGNSSGSYGAMRYALDLGAAAVLCLAGPSVLDRSVPALLERQRLRGATAEPVDPARLDLAVLYAEAERHPRLRILFGADNEVDRREAQNMARLPGVELVPVPGFKRHGILPALVVDGTFDRQLDWLVAAGT